MNEKSYTELSVNEMFDFPGKSNCLQKVWGYGVDQSPIVSIKVGGTVKPSVLICAGVHAHESAGVFAALELIRHLDTQLEVSILPLRDPFGFSGVKHCLRIASGLSVELNSHSDAFRFLEKHGTKLLKIDDLEIFLLGKFGFIWYPIQSGLEGFEYVNNRMKILLKKETQKLRLLRGKSVMLLNPAVDYEGSREMQRCWHAFVDDEGAWKNLNRFPESGYIPSEVRAMQNMFSTINPGLIIDLQEDGASGFWLAAPPQDNMAVLQIGKAMLETFMQNKYSIYTVHSMSRDGHRDLEIPGFLEVECSHPGFFWMKQDLMQEGSNLLSFAAQKCTAIGVEAPLILPLKERVNGIVEGVKAGIRAWEEVIRLKKEY
ncbi:MAG: hypothetical protein JEZ06_03540 [Anaerolineaceae bacterium]|nr:hypothetical protein [Anaerolineaceae bacterium]